jgi:hypothetical protein
MHQSLTFCATISANTITPPSRSTSSTPVTNPPAVPSRAAVIAIAMARYRPP